MLRTLDGRRINRIPVIRENSLRNWRRNAIRHSVVRWTPTSRAVKCGTSEWGIGWELVETDVIRQMAPSFLEQFFSG